MPDVLGFAPYFGGQNGAGKKEQPPSVQRSVSKFDLHEDIGSGGLWVMNPETIRCLYSLSGGSLFRMNAPQPPSYELRGSVAIIGLRGILSRGGLMGGTSTVLFRDVLKSAVANPSVSGVVIVCYSPGGGVPGTDEAAEAVAAAAGRKPVIAFIEDEASSGAYWIASQATKIYSHEIAFIGSIGTFAVVHDSSKLAEKEGIKVHIVKAGDFKGMGTPGTPVKDEHLTEMQRMVNSVNELFVRAVSAGRKLTGARLNAVTDGRLHLGEKAVGLGLIDGIKRLDSIVAELQKPA